MRLDSASGEVDTYREALPRGIFPLDFVTFAGKDVPQTDSPKVVGVWIGETVGEQLRRPYWCVFLSC